MFGKRKQDRKHRFAEGDSGELPDAEARPESNDPDLAAALMQLGRNRHAPLPEPPSVEESELDEPSEPDESSDLDKQSELDAPRESDELNEPDVLVNEQSETLEQDEAEEPAPTVPELANGFAHAGVQTAAMLAEPEDAGAAAVDEDATYAALRRERAKVVEQQTALREAQERIEQLTAEIDRLQSSDAGAQLKAAQERAEEFERSSVESQVRIDSLTAELNALRTESGDTDVVELRGAAERADRAERSFLEAQVRVASLTADLERARSESSTAAADEVRTAVERADAAERSVLELKSKVSALKAELERSRSEAAAAGVALERVEREAKDQDGRVAAAEERAEQLAAEIEQLRADAAKGPAQVERLRREAEREKALRAAMEQAQASHEQAEAVLADNRRLASDLAANIQSQEGLIAALTGLQTEVTEQRAWFEAQIATVRETENQQASVVDALQAAIQDRDIELELLRQQLLEAEAKRAEEAAAFVAALERQ